MNTDFYLSACHPPLCGSETPLSVAVQSGLPMEGFKLLVQGGAHLDFRNTDGLTAVHKAVQAQNHTGLLVRTLQVVTAPLFLQSNLFIAWGNRPPHSTLKQQVSKTPYG